MSTIPNLAYGQNRLAQVPLTPTFLTVTGTSQQAVAANSLRTGIILANTSSDTIYLAFGSSAAVVGSGIVLTPVTTPNSRWVMENVNFTITSINAISSGTFSNLSIQEFS